MQPDSLGCGWQPIGFMMDRWLQWCGFLWLWLALLLTG
jgi:hypothetical protein